MLPFLNFYIGTRISRCHLVLAALFLTGASSNAQAADSGGFGGIWIFVFIIVVGAVVLYDYVEGLKCPRCRKNLALRKSGHVKREYWQADLEEWQCRYCDYQGVEEKQEYGG